MKESTAPKLTADPAKVKSWNYRLAFLGLMLLEAGGRNDRLRTPYDGRKRLNMRVWHGSIVWQRSGHQCAASCCVAGYSHFLFDKLFDESPRGWEGQEESGSELPWALRYLVAPSRMLSFGWQSLPYSQRANLAWYLCAEDYPDSVRGAARRIYMLLEHPEFVRDEIAKDYRTRRANGDGSWSDLPHAAYFEQKGVPTDTNELRRTFQRHIDHTPCLATTV